MSKRPRLSEASSEQVAADLRARRFVATPCQHHACPPAVPTNDAVEVALEALVVAGDLADRLAAIVEELLDLLSGGQGVSLSSL